MKSKLLGFMGLVGLLGGAPANASTYDVNLDGLGGTIVTDCDSCTLGASDFVSWTFTGDGYSISGGPSGVSGSSTLPLSASSGVISFDSAPPSEYVYFTASNGYALFEPFNGTGEFYLDINGAGAVVGADTSNPVTLAIETTPLPAALPLFSAGLGVLGLFGWRSKRKNAAALVAA
jgi:hypothetical protein